MGQKKHSDFKMNIPVNILLNVMLCEFVGFKCTSIQVNSIHESSKFLSAPVSCMVILRSLTSC